jgi:hypothetical protein
MVQGIIVRFARILACFKSRVRPTDLRSCMAWLVGGGRVCRGQDTRSIGSNSVLRAQALPACKSMQ